jgi:hypothetical protein
MYWQYPGIPWQSEIFKKIENPAHSPSHFHLLRAVIIVNLLRIHPRQILNLDEIN